MSTFDDERHVSRPQAGSTRVAHWLEAHVTSSTFRLFASSKTVMAPKRKSDGVDSSSAAAPSDDQAHVSGDDASVKAVPPPAKKRKSEAKADSGMAGKTWKDITIEGEDEVWALT
jgi:hypothetical protein